jgi:ABC-type branched-subunit amino acid transport system ATPase component
MSDALRLDAIGKRFGAQVALEDVSLAVGDG